ncbi:MAG: ATP-binding protein, partial [Rhodospirillaceae bacterium]|nr:ATP-binding protein [Rhodospirillaceae bacterium]
KSRGAGLGLPTARRIVESHGGSLTARPRDGGGTVLTVTLPLRQAVGYEA